MSTNIQEKVMEPEKTTELTLNDIQLALPSKKGTITQDIVDIFNNSQINTSDAINTFMTGISFTGVGAVVAGVWFVADIGTGIITGTSLSDRIDNSVGGPLVDW